MDAVKFDRLDDIAVITIENPPVNAISEAVRWGLLAAAERVDSDDAVAAAILICAGRTFAAGADIREFGKPPQGPTLPEVVNRIEAMSKPILAAIHGQALGGGFELALGCHYRIALASAKVGTPEVNLELIPGAGACVRLPRLIGIKPALDMVTGGAPVAAAKAASLGAIDRVAEGEDLLASALAYARALIDGGAILRRLSAKPVDQASVNDGVFAEARAAIARDRRGFLAPLKAVDAIEAAARLPFAEASKVERQLFVSLRDSPQAAAQRHLFLAERDVGRVPGLPKDTPKRPIRAVAVIGAGIMGSGIATAFANTGFPVTMLDMAEDALQRGLGRIRQNYEASVRKGRLSQEDMDKRMASIRGISRYADLAEADLVVEAVFESMEAKRDVFAKLDAACKPGAILATNTSYLDVNAIAAATTRPQDVLGLHFFNPANIMKLLEIVEAEKTSPDVLSTCVELAKRLGKTGIVTGVGFGFIGNRMLNAYRTEALRIALEGAPIARIDKALYEFGLPMGPFALTDLTGLDINVRMRKEADPRLIDAEAFRIVDRLHDMGRLGQKTGAGFYTYAEDRRPNPDPEVDAMLAEEATALGLTRRGDIEAGEIVERCLLRLANEGAKILGDGIAKRASDIDLTYVSGYGFPRYVGGPMFWAEQQGLAQVVARLRHYGELYGAAAWTPAPRLAECAAAGRRFDEPAASTG